MCFLENTKSGRTCAQLQRDEDPPPSAGDRSRSTGMLDLPLRLRGTKGQKCQLCLHTHAPYEGLKRRNGGDTNIFLYPPASLMFQAVPLCITLPLHIRGMFKHCDKWALTFG